MEYIKERLRPWMHRRLKMWLYFRFFTSYYKNRYHFNKDILNLYSKYGVKYVSRLNLLVDQYLYELGDLYSYFLNSKFFKKIEKITNEKGKRKTRITKVKNWWVFFERNVKESSKVNKLKKKYAEVLEWNYWSDKTYQNLELFWKDFNLAKDLKLTEFKSALAQEDYDQVLVRTRLLRLSASERKALVLGRGKALYKAKSKLFISDFSTNKKSRWLKNNWIRLWKIAMFTDTDINRWSRLNYRKRRRFFFKQIAQKYDLFLNLNSSSNLTKMFR